VAAKRRSVRARAVFEAVSVGEVHAPSLGRRDLSIKQFGTTSPQVRNDDERA
jgi:hypothetical protein